MSKNLEKIKNMNSKLLNNQFGDILNLIRKSRINALKTVNKELINLYWKIGKHISIKINKEEWGESTVQKLSEFIQNKEPEIRGFSPQNIWRMKSFYETYKDFPKLSTLLREIPWSANLHILSKTKTIEEKEFYLNFCIKNCLSVRELERSITTSTFERQTLSKRKLSTVLRELHPKSENMLRDRYIFDFLSLPDNFNESDLQKGLIQNLKKFLNEIGKDFCFIQENFHLQVGSQDFFIDLLFYHRELCCLVAFELKIDYFKPEYLGKINFYLEALDRLAKKPHEKPSVGVLLCKSKDDTVVEFALSRSLSPTLVAEYETKLINKNLLKAKLNELYDLEETGKT